MQSVVTVGGSVHTLRLLRGVVDVDVLCVVPGGEEFGLVGSLSLVSSEDGSAPRVCPVDVLLKQSYTIDPAPTLQNYRHTKPNVTEYYKIVIRIL